MTRSAVRVGQTFFDDLDEQLREARGPQGEPSASDFLLIDLPVISATFAERFDELPPFCEGRADYRYLVATGKLVRSALVVGQRLPDGAIALVALEIELG